MNHMKSQFRQFICNRGICRKPCIPGCYFGGLLAIRGTIGVSDIQAFIQYVKNFTANPARLLGLSIRYSP
ncbi:MAG: hypothetical protein ACLRYY_06245 [Anaerobutyricum soehngenii]